MKLLKIQLVAGILVTHLKNGIVMLCPQEIGAQNIRAITSDV